MLRSFVDKHPTLMKDANLESVPGLGHSTVVSQHLHHLLILLRQQLLQHRFPQAAATMEAITMATDKVVDIVRKVGLETLLNDKEAYGECLQFYKQMFSKFQRYREENLLEMAFYIASHGNLQEAYDAMVVVVYVNPFRENPLLHGYCGLLQLMLWRECVAKERAQASLSRTPPSSSEPPPTPLYRQLLREDGDSRGGPRSGKAESHAKTALNHFEELQRRLFAGSYVVDAFVYKHSELLEGLGRLEEARTLLLSYKMKHPKRINPNRYLCDHLRCYHGDDPIQRIPHLRDLVSADESCDEAVELAELLLQQDSADPTDPFHLLLNFLDYPSNGRREKAWELLEQILAQWPQLQSDRQWTGRRQWWGKLYPQHMSATAS